MYRVFIKPLGLVVMLAIIGFFASCQKDEVTSDVENFVLRSTQGIESACGAGITGCYELVFPVTIQFSDSTAVEVTDYTTLRQAIRDWFTANGGHPKSGDRPTLVYPIQVLNQAGELITVESPSALKDLLLLCVPVIDTTGTGGHHGDGGDHGNGGHHGNGGPGDHHGDGGPCFTVDFPVTVSFPDSTQVTVNDSKELAQATRDWNKNNPGQHGHPEFVFPLTVTLKDGTQAVVNTKEDLRAIKDACRG